MSNKSTHIINIDSVELEKINAVYFIGIGGIGMSALARYFHSKGKIVSGYDRMSTVLTQELEASGITIHYEENLEKISTNVQLVVYTPAIPNQNSELQYYFKNNYLVVKRSDVLQILTKNTFNICIAGTHGKTTISTMIAHVLRHSGYGCNAFLGGISVNYKTNFWSSNNEVCVIEADEYDRSFLKLFPDVAIISSTDADHLDIYGTAQEVEKAFIDFSKNVKTGGLLVYKFGLKNSKEFSAKQSQSYCLNNNQSDVYVNNIKIEDGGYRFDVVVCGRLIKNFTLHMGGMHNVENAVAAIATASYLKIDDDLIRNAIDCFKGVKRRFEYVLNTSKIIQIDDYAHHPEELTALINGAKTLFSSKKCTLIFQPHLFSRTKDFADAFAAALDLADEVILLPIYPARELPIPGVESEMLLSKMKNGNKKIMSKNELLDAIATKNSNEFDNELGEVIITAGAGDIDTIVTPLKQILEKKYKSE